MGQNDDHKFYVLYGVFLCVFYYNCNPTSTYITFVSPPCVQWAQGPITKYFTTGLCNVKSLDLFNLNVTRFERGVDMCITLRGSVWSFVWALRCITMRCCNQCIFSRCVVCTH